MAESIGRWRRGGVARLCGGLAVLAGSLDLLGWAFDARWLAAPLPGSRPTDPLTSVMLLLLGLGGLAARSKQHPALPRLAQIVGTAVTMVGFARLGDWFQEWPIRFDHMLFYSVLQTRGALDSVGMSGAAAAGLIASGTALWLLARPPGRGTRPGQLLAGLTALIASIGVVGYAYGAILLYQFGQGPPLALNTALMLLVVATGLLALHPRIGLAAIVTTSDLGGQGARRLTACVILIPFLLGALWVRSEASGWVAGVTGIAVFVTLTSLTLTVSVLLMSRKLSRMSATIARHARQLDAARRAAEAANRAKSDFLANMSQELHPPLNAIIGFSDLIGESGRDMRELETHVEYAQYINQAGQQLLRIVDNVFDMTRIESGRYVLRKRACDVRRAVALALPDMWDAAERNGVTMIDLVPDDLPPIQADEFALHHMLTQLLSNAVKFTHRGGTVTVFAESAVGRDARRSVIIRVADTGVGMQPGEIALALTPFGHAETARPSERGGAGLGLPLTRQLVELHGGRLEVESEPDAGTVVRVHFPI